jgi:hypothetical protein
MADGNVTELRPKDRIDEPTVREHRANSSHCKLTGDCMAGADSTTLPTPIPTPLNETALVKPRLPLQSSKVRIQGSDEPKRRHQQADLRCRTYPREEKKGIVWSW